MLFFITLYKYIILHSKIQFLSQKSCGGGISVLWMHCILIVLKLQYICIKNWLFVPSDSGVLLGLGIGIGVCCLTALICCCVYGFCSDSVRFVNLSTVSIHLQGFFDLIYQRLLLVLAKFLNKTSDSKQATMPVFQHETRIAVCI